MANKRSNIEIILSALDVNLTKVVTKGQAALEAFRAEAGSGSVAIASMRSQVLQLAGAFAGLQAIGDVGAMLQEADRNAYGLAASIKAANREFAVGSAAEWEQTIADLSNQLKIYSTSDIKGATAATIDMTKRLGLNADQMKQVIALSGDLAAGRTDLAGAVERVTAALRGEAEASEYLGLTLNETYVKTWYEARGAMQGAWKDLTDLQKAQVRYNVFLEQALPLQGKAAESIHTYDGALKLIRKTVSDSITSNQDLVDALKQVATVLNDNAAGIGSLVASLASGAARIIEFVVANRELLLIIGEYGFKFGFAATAIGKLIATAKGLNAAFAVLTGSSILPWLRSVETASMATTTAVTGLKVGFIGLLGAVAAYFAAYKLGDWLAMHKELEGIAKAQGELERATKKVNAEFKNISQSTGVTVTSMEELDQAVKDGRIHYDELTGTWVKGAKTQQQATTQTASTMKQVTGDALKEMQKQYREYAETVKAAQEDIDRRTQSVSERIREMNREEMSDKDAWLDRKKEAEEYFAASVKAKEEGQAALQSGDAAMANLKFAEAKEAGDKAIDAYAQLKGTIKDGETIFKTSSESLKIATSGMQKAANVANAAVRSQMETAAAAMDGLIQKSGFADLAKGMDDVQRAWLTNWKNMQAASTTAVEQVEERIVKMVTPERTVWINVRAKVAEDAKRFLADSRAEATVNQFALGGLIQKLATGGGVRNLLGGGHFPGYGGGDRRLVMAEDGEFMVRKEVVRATGLHFFQALNAGRLDLLANMLSSRIGETRGYRIGGVIDTLPRPPVQALATGGSVGGSGAQAPDKVVELRFPGGQVQGNERSVEALLRQLEQAGLSA